MKTFFVNNDIIEEVEVSAGRTNILIYAMYDGVVVEKHKVFTNMVNMYHLEAYIEELTYGTKLSKDILKYIKSKI
jgi:hypothetical protein